MVYIFLYEKRGHKIKLEGATSIKQKELLLHTAHSGAVKLLASGCCGPAKIT